MLISPGVRAKLADDDHKVTEEELIECFANRSGKECIDNRAWHRTNPPTRWFVAQTDRGRRLKICYVLDNGIVEVKTAYNATPEIIRIYEKYGI